MISIMLNSIVPLGAAIGYLKLFTNNSSISLFAWIAIAVISWLTASNISVNHVNQTNIHFPREVAEKKPFRRRRRRKPKYPKRNGRKQPK